MIGLDGVMLAAEVVVGLANAVGGALPALARLFDQRTFAKANLFIWVLVWEGDATADDESGTSTWARAE